MSCPSVCINQIIATAIVTLLYTGFRCGELLGLTWDEVLPDALLVRRGVYLQDNKPTYDEMIAKTEGSIRKVPLQPFLLERIDRLPRNGQYVFGVNTGGLMHPRNFNRDYTTFFHKLREIHPECRHLSPHCCRHTYATLALAGGANIKVVGDILGHKDIKTTARYTHPDHAIMLQAVNNMHSLIRKK